MKQHEIFYFDIDGTLLDNSNQKISPLSIEALRSLKEQGYKLAVCTGRTLAGTETLNLQDIVKWDMYLLANGGQILNSELEVLQASSCDKQFLQDVINIHQEGIILEGDHLYLTEALTDEMTEFMNGGGHYDIPINTDLDDTVYKFIIEHLDKFEGGFNHELFKGYDYNLNTHHMYEVYPEHVGKEHAIAFANDYLSIEKSTFFGDGLNDLEALKAADVGVAMGNAVDDVKKVADVTTTSVSNNGIYNYLKSEKLI